MIKAPAQPSNEKMLSQTPVFISMEQRFPTRLYNKGCKALLWVEIKRYPDLLITEKFCSSEFSLIIRHIQQKRGESFIQYPIEH